MPSFIEKAKSGRAKCRKCREKIEKDELRLGCEVKSDFGESTQWFHLKCAAEKVPAELEKALNDWPEAIPEQEELQEVIQNNRGKQKPATLPYAELAPSGRSTCLVCESKIAKGETRIAIEREIDTGSFVRMGAGYLHPQCAFEYEETPDDLVEQIQENSVSLDEKQMASIVAELDG